MRPSTVSPPCGRGMASTLISSRRGSQPQTLNGSSKQFQPRGSAANPRSAARRGARYSCQALVPGTRASRMDQPRTKLQSRRSTFAAVSPDHRRTARTSDYVLFKLDIDNIETEQGIVDQLLSPEGAADLAFIDEIFRGTSWAKPVRVLPPYYRTFDSDACHRTTVSSYGTADASVRSGVRCG